MPRLIWVFAGRTLILLVLLCRGLFLRLWHPETPKFNKKNGSKVTWFMAFRERASKMAAGDSASSTSRMRVFPHTSDGIDMSISTVGFRGGALSSITETELESQRNRMTLEEARWTGVRKKVPGMKGIPKQTHSKTGLRMEAEYDPYTKVRYIF